MDPMKQMIQQKLIANVGMDQCARQEHLIFRDSWCSQERAIRFTTPFWQNLLGEGDVMYEAENKPDSFVVHCVCKSDRKDPTVAKIRAIFGAADGDVLHSWDISNSDPNAIFNAFNVLISKTIPAFEKDLETKLQADFVEGEQEAIFTTKYERNPPSSRSLPCLPWLYL